MSAVVVAVHLAVHIARQVIGRLTCSFAASSLPKEWPPSEATG